MKILVIASTIDLKNKLGCTPAWWQLLKALHEIGNEVIVIPYLGNPVERLWWRSYDNLCRKESIIYNSYLEGRKKKWIDDVASAIAKYLFLDITQCEVFNLGNTEPVTIKELAQKLFEKAKQRGVIASEAKLIFMHKPIYDDDVRIRIPSIEKAQSKLHWNPTLTLDEALDRCLDEALTWRRQDEG